MAEKNIPQNLITRLGQSQHDRYAPALNVHFADIDERTPEDFLLATKELAKMVQFYGINPSSAVATWEKFFPYSPSTVSQLMQHDLGTLSPHLALFCTFLHLYTHPQHTLNQISGRHLDFYFSRILGFSPKSSIPDRAHVVLELKKLAAPVAIGPSHHFSAGKDDTGIERLYVPTRETVINPSKIASLRSLYVDRQDTTTIRHAPIADSADGVGSPFDPASPKWSGFGHAGLKPAQVGFAIAAPLLKMKEGSRKIILKLQLDNVDFQKLNSQSLSHVFLIFLTGEETWIEPTEPIVPTLNRQGLLTLEITIEEGAPPIVDYDSHIHGYSFSAQSPIVQVLLNGDDHSVDYDMFQGVVVKTAEISVEVSQITSLDLDSDGGKLDPKKSFLPFGPLPTIGSRFLIGYPEALSKKLSEVTVSLTWKDAPSSFSNHYHNYTGVHVTNESFTSTVAFQDGGEWQHVQPGIQLFHTSDARMEHTLRFVNSDHAASPAKVSRGLQIHALHTSQSVWGKQAAFQSVLANPMYQPYRQTMVPHRLRFKRFQPKLNPKIQEGFIHLSLESDFFHSAYRTQYTQNVLNFSTGAATELKILNEPYTPTVQAISLGYKAGSQAVDLSSPSLEEFSRPDLHFFHLSYFGNMREHGYQRARFEFLSDPKVSLFPQYSQEGELLIGFANLQPQESVSVFFQVSEGSANPERNQEQVQWSVLCDNYWKPLKRNHVVLDTTNQLLTSGIITFMIPREATTTNSILPSDLLWIKGGITSHVDAVSQFIAVHANGIEVKFLDQGNDPAHLQTPLPQGMISGLKHGISPLKGVKQPSASFGGSPTEGPSSFYTRVSERLRHKNRCITPWDYERMILDQFPAIHKVKCIPHAREGSWLAPGHVMIVVIPDLRNQNTMNPLEPKMSANLLSNITAFLETNTNTSLTSQQLHVKNPLYQKVQLDFKVQFHRGYEFNYYSGLLNQQLIQFLSPWAFSQTGDIAFGGTIFKSVVLDFVEELSFVDYITDFHMYSLLENEPHSIDIQQITPSRPDAIMVSVSQHRIEPVS